MKVRQNGEYKKRKFENIVRRSDGYINCFQSHECIWNVTSGDFDISVQEYNISRYDYKKLESPRPILTILVKMLHHRLLT